mgnify:CR=1 FL=1
MKQPRHNTKSKSSAAEAGKGQGVVHESLGQVKTADNDSSPDKSASQPRAFEASLEKFRDMVGETMWIQGRDTIEQAITTFDHLRESVSHIRETISQAKMARESLKSSAKRIADEVRQNPEPFIAATIPGLIGIYLLAKKVRANISHH